MKEINFESQKIELTSDKFKVEIIYNSGSENWTLRIGEKLRKERELYAQGFKNIASDEEMLELADEGIEDYNTSLNNWDADE